MPRSATTTRPQNSAPGWTTIPTFGNPMVTVTAARTQGPSTRPVSASSPEGTSTASTGIPDSLRVSMARAASPTAGPRKPVPKMASTTN
jgi:hypothetical protein